MSAAAVEPDHLDPDAQTYDRHAETSTLAACLHSRTARDTARRYVTAGDFLDPSHEHIWRAMSELDRTSTGVDPAALLLRLQATHPAAARLLPDLVTWPAFADHVADYATVVREWATRRRLANEATRTRQQALDPRHDAPALAATVANRFAAIRDTGVADDIESRTLGEILAEEDPEPDWVVPGLLERSDRFVLTGEEGLGKASGCDRSPYLPQPASTPSRAAA